MIKIRKFTLPAPGVEGLLAAVMLTAVSAGAAVDVTRFGATPDDPGDDTAAFVAAFRAAAAGSDGRLVIPKGQYHLNATNAPGHRGALLSAARRGPVSIEGDGAELLIRGMASVFSFSECTNVSARGLVIDWERPPFSEGIVAAAGARFIDVQVAAGYPVHGGEQVGAFMSYDPVTRLPTGKNLDVYGSVERTELIGPQMLRLHFTREIAVPLGTLLVLRHQVYGYNAFNFYRCAGVRASDVTVYSAPGMGLAAINSSDLTLSHFNVCLRPNSGRLMSATADATHFGGCKGTVTLEDCLFEGMGDDGANVKSGLYLIVRQRLDAQTVLGQHNLKMADLPDPGDRMEMAHTDTLTAFATRQVQAAKMAPGEGNFHRVTFAEPLPAELREGDVLGNASRVPKLRMRRCTVRANRARGVLCQTRDALIEDCAFRNCTSAGVLVLTEVVHFYESIGTRDVTVRHNLFENCNRGAAAAEASLAALAWLKDFAYPTKPGVHRDVTFEGNRFVGADGKAIFAVGVDGLTIRNNQIEPAIGPSTDEKTPDPIRVLNCARVTREDRTMD